MKKKVLCIALALLLCTMAIAPAFADNNADTPPDRAVIIASFSLKKVSGSTYRMSATISNMNYVEVIATLALYDASYNYITSVGKTSSDLSFSMAKTVTLSSGTYHLRLTYRADGAIKSFEKTYSI